MLPQGAIEPAHDGLTAKGHHKLLGVVLTRQGEMDKRAGLRSDRDSLRGWPGFRQILLNRRQAVPLDEAGSTGSLP